MTTDSWATVLTKWPLDPQILIPIVVAGLLYWLGTTSTLAVLPEGHRLGPRRWKIALFYLSLALILVALQSPLDYLAAKLMWAHMIQHLILIMLAPPLMLLGDPAMPLLRGLPIALRRRALGTIFGWRWLHVLGAALGRVSRPIPAFALATCTVWFWHWPAMYNLTLSNQAVHYLEHVTFLLASVNFWWQVIDQTQFRCRLGYAHRALFVFCGAVQNHFLAVILAFAPKPLYAYAHLVQRPGGISALTDQQLAGGFMWVPGMMMYGTAFTLFLIKWLQSQQLPIGASSFEDIPRVPRQLRRVSGGRPYVAPVELPDIAGK